MLGQQANICRLQIFFKKKKFLTSEFKNAVSYWYFIFNVMTTCPRNIYSICSNMCRTPLHMPPSACPSQSCRRWRDRLVWSRGLNPASLIHRETARWQEGVTVKYCKISQKNIFFYRDALFFRCVGFPSIRTGFFGGFALNKRSYYISFRLILIILP